MKFSEKLESACEIEEQNKSLTPSFVGKTLNIEISNYCNEDCIYCIYAAQGIHKKGKLIDESLFKHITREAYELGITDVGLYMKGEPLINPKICDYIYYLKKEIGFSYVYISTNGILLNKQKLIDLVNAGIDSIKFSLSAVDCASFIKHHGVDKYEVVVQNIQNAYEYRKQNNLNYKLYMFVILTKYNVEQKHLFEEQFSPYVDEIVFSSVLDGIIELKGLKEYLMIDDQHCGSNSLPCPDLFNRIAIDEDGYLCLCCFSGHSLTRVLDIKKMKLKDALYSKEMQEIRKRHIQGKVEHTICNRCVYGIKETMYSFNPDISTEAFYIESIDREDEIKKRFL